MARLLLGALSKTLDPDSWKAMPVDEYNAKYGGQPPRDGYGGDPYGRRPGPQQMDPYGAYGNQPGMYDNRDGGMGMGLGGGMRNGMGGGLGGGLGGGRRRYDDDYYYDDRDDYRLSRRERRRERREDRRDRRGRGPGPIGMAMQLGSGLLRDGRVGGMDDRRMMVGGGPPGGMMGPGMGPGYRNDGFRPAMDDQQMGYMGPQRPADQPVEYPPSAAYPYGYRSSSQPPPQQQRQMQPSPQPQRQSQQQMSYTPPPEKQSYNPYNRHPSGSGPSQIGESSSSSSGMRDGPRELRGPSRDEKRRPGTPGSEDEEERDEPPPAYEEVVRHRR